ncbi:MAG: polyamine aminopropyltransferase [Gammaproteobacteria bacterium]|nr:MAG: polyamine aminopropyltransferase [Gammaproteobacteria bacterium]
MLQNLSPKSWFTEASEETGVAFSLHLKAHLHHEVTPYQTIDVYDTTTFGHLMTIDGLTMVSERDNFIYHEMMTHPALFAHPDPASVAIIGGGDCGTLREVLKHNDVKSAVQIEIDERVTRVAEQFFPDLCGSNDDPRCQLLFDDGIAWVNSQPDQSLDILIIDSTDPVGPAEGLFSRPFYQQASRVLKPNGILIQQSESPLLHDTLIQSMHFAMREAGFTDTATLTFPLCSYPSGWWSATLASCELLKRQPREDKIIGSRLSMRYYNEHVHRASFALPQFLQTLLNQV